MGRTQLSYSWQSARWVAGGVLGLVYVIIAYCQKQASDSSIGSLLLALLLPAGIFWGIKRLLWADATLGSDFDRDFWYLHRESGIEPVPLANVQRIKFTMTELAGASVWKINYRATDGQLRSLRILPTWLGRMAEFKEAVRQQNPQVELVNSSHSVDFDQ